MKKFFLFASVLMLAVVSNAAEPKSGFQTLSVPAIIPVANSPTNLPTPLLIDASGQHHVRFFFSVSSADTSSTTNVTYKIAPGYSATQLDTNNAILLTANVKGKTVFSTGTNYVTSNGNLRYYLYQIDIGANSIVTNNTAAWELKTLAP